MRRRCGLSTLTVNDSRLASAGGFEGVNSVAAVLLDGRFSDVSYGRAA